MKYLPPLHRGNDNIIDLQAGPSPEKPAGRVDPASLSNTHPPEQPIETPDPISSPPDDEQRDSDDAFAPVSIAEAGMLSLSPPQQTAIKLLTSGHTLVAAATAAGVTRMTLYRWLKGDAAFSAAYNAWQKDILDTARGRLLSLSDLAVTTVAKSMSRGDGKIALKVLQSLGALDRPKPGATDPEEIERQQTLEWKKAKTAARKEEDAALMDDLLM